MANAKKNYSANEHITADANSYWLIEEGSIDIYGGSDSQAFIGQIDQGCWIFPHPANEDSTHLILKAGIDTTLRALTSEDVKSADFSKALHRWISLLSQPFTKRWVSQRATLWPESGEWILQKAETVVTTPSLLQRREASQAWIKVKEGSVQVGRATNTLLTPHSPPFPLPERLSLVAKETTTLELLADPPPQLDVTLLALFYRWILNELEIDLEQQAARNRQQLENTEALNETLTHASTKVLASVLRKDRLTNLSTADNPLVRACDTVADFMGLNLRTQGVNVDTAQPVNEQVGSLCARSHIRYRSVHLSDSFWSQDHGPLLAFFTPENKPVALLPATGKAHYTMVDPQTNTAQSLTKELAAQVGPQGFMFYKPFPSQPFGKKLLQFATEGYGRDLGIIAFAAFLSSLLALYLPMAMSWIFDKVVPNHSYGLLYQIFAGFVCVAVGQSLFMITKFYALLRIEGNVGNRLQAALWDRLLRIGLRFYHNYSTGDLFQRVNAFDQMRQILGGSLLASIVGGLFSISYLIVMFYHNWELTLLLLVPVSIALIAYTVGLLLTVAREMRVYNMEGRLNGLLVQALTGIAKIRVSGSENRTYSRWAELFAQKKSAEVQAARIRVWLDSIKNCFPLFGNVVLYFFAIYIIQHELAGKEPSMPTGEFLAFSTALGAFSAGILGVAETLSQVAGKVVPLWRRARVILEEEPEVTETRDPVGQLNGRVTLDHVCFRYDKNQPMLLKDICLDIHPGQFAALVGSSGCGKSTLVKLLLGFESPETGKLYYDHNDVSSVDLVALRKQIGVVLQDGAILGGTIRDNVTCGRKFTDEEIKQTLEFCGFTDELESLPMGLDTILPNGGGTLSGGQRQRLMIARAVMAKPRVLLFDEATSALDNETQELVSHNIDRLNATRIVIAHRLSTIQNADVIFLLHEGKVTDRGTYQELMQRSSFFQTLVKRQQ